MGYLTQRGEDDYGRTELVIPNKMICWMFDEYMQEWSVISGKCRKVNFR